MKNPIVRKGFCAAILRISLEQIEETEQLPTHLHHNYADDKLGLQILELKKFLEELQTGEDIVN